MITYCREISYPIRHSNIYATLAPLQQEIPISRYTSCLITSFRSCRASFPWPSIISQRVLSTFYWNCIPCSTRRYFPCCFSLRVISERYDPWSAFQAEIFRRNSDIFPSRSRSSTTASFEVLSLSAARALYAWLKLRFVLYCS